MLYVKYITLYYIIFSIIQFLDTGFGQPEALNEKAVQIINRVRDKLTGIIKMYLFL